MLDGEAVVLDFCGVVPPATTAPGRPVFFPDWEVPEEDGIVKFFEVGVVAMCDYGRSWTTLSGSLGCFLEKKK